MLDSFSYESFTVNDDQQTVSFQYALHHDNETYCFCETITFPVSLPDTPEQHAALHALHLALGISYYKIFCPPAIAHPYAMDEHEAAFWNTVWEQGLREFLYVNHLSPSRLARFATQDGTRYKLSTATHTEPRVLLGIGGGKDSIVAGETLRRCNVPVTGFVMATGAQRGQAQAVADAMGIAMQAIERRLDPELLRVQELPGAYKGHVPISLVFALIGTTLAVATNAAYVAAGNEASASIPRHQNEHGSINHQWSKSFEAEQAIQQYIHAYVSPAVTYFSAVRQLTSIGVAKLFTRYPQYFEIFTSDNAVFRVDPAKRPNGRWSLESPKSLSSFILLAPWLSEDTLQRIFGDNLLSNASLEPLFWQLTGQEGEPPLDCVGTTEEIVTSLNLAAQQGKFGGSILLEAARQRNVVNDQNWGENLQKMLALQPDQAVPSAIRGSIADTLQEELAA
jgi:UDP-N-acetyl-alpha-D-muramoyl-L-alanyl-L-glutamate epimerase